MGFRDQGIDPAPGFVGDGFVVRPLMPADNALDHAAVMASREFLYHWEQDPPYPAEDHSLVDNLADLERMRREHEAGTRYTYTVMSADEGEVLGCVYLFAADDRMFAAAEVESSDGADFSTVDLALAFWARVDTWAAGFERDLLRGVWTWIRSEWTVRSPVVLTNAALEQQIATIESLGLARRFAYERERDMYLNLVYG